MVGVSQAKSMVAGASHSDKVHRAERLGPAKAEVNAKELQTELPPFMLDLARPFSL